MKALYIILFLSLFPLLLFSQQKNHYDSYFKGCDFFENKQFDDAIKEFNKAIALDSANSNAYLFRGYSYFYKGTHTSAFSDLNKAVELTSGLGSETMISNRGHLYLLLEEYDKAMIDFDRAIEINPRYSTAYHNRGIIYHKTKEFEKALSDYNKSIELDKTGSDTYYSRGTLYIEIEKYKEALSDLNIAISKREERYKKYPSQLWFQLDPDYYINRAIVYQKLNDNANAIQDYEKAIELKPELETELRPVINGLK